MGISKAMLPFGPERLLNRVIRLLEAVVAPVAVVGSPDQDLSYLPERVIVARDHVKDRGPLQALHAGLTAVQGHTEAAYVMGCDTPFLVEGFVRRMITLLGNHEIVVPKEGRFFHPLAAVYRTSVLPHIEALLDANRMKPVLLFNQTDTREVAIDELRDVDPELMSLENLNTPAEYLKALRRSGFEAPAEILERLKKPRP
jgi:molybdopterin-guanine dinucleotide biosynthesis protein A